MDVLVACEYSGVVSNAFRLMGHNAWSCDIVPGKSPDHHIVGDALEVINSQKWDLVIAHPPCTYVAKAGLHHLINNPERQLQQKASIQFIKNIFNSSVSRVALENPIGALTKLWCAPTQIVYPWYWQEPYGKEICLWLKNLPPLHYDRSIIKPKKLKSVMNHVNSRMSQAEKTRIKSKFFHNVAMAMAEQWGNLSPGRPLLVPRSSPTIQTIAYPPLFGRLSLDRPPESIEFQ